MPNWKKKYDDARQQRIATDPEYAARVRANQARARAKRDERDPEYNRRYYAANKHKWKRRTAEQQAKHNDARRANYAADPSVRERACADARRWQKENPGKAKNQRLRRYGIGLADYERILVSQGGGCAICGAVECVDADPRTGKRRRLHVDHCHISGVVRGLLCSGCNKALGLFYDNPERLERAAVYLRTADGAAAKSPDK